MKGGKPFAYFGRQWSLKSITLATIYPHVIHELFHVAAGYHEQDNYKSIAVAPVLFNNVMQYYRKEFKPAYSKKAKVVDGTIITSFFDLGAPTLYPLYSASETGFPVYDVMYQDQFVSDAKRVFMDEISRDISDLYDCWGMKNCGTKPICDNEGYPGYYNKECGCVCPRGLDSVSNCDAIKTKPSGSWPDTDIQLLKTTSGCPAGLTESTAVVTGITAMTTSSYYNLATALSGDTLTVYLCSKPSAGNTEVWDHGMNGFLAGNNQCPSALESGDINFSSTSGASVGSLDFCVQQGLVEEPLMGLPTTDEFAVFSRSDTCQEIDGFVARRDSFTIHHPDIVTSGDLPYHTLTNSNGEFVVKFDVCVYTPLSYNCGAVIKLDAANPSQVITSFNHPSNYPANTECNWFIEVEDDAKIRAEFLAFDVDDTDTFTYRRYILNAVPSKLTKTSSLPRNLVSVYNRMALHFRSGAVGSQGTGFQIVVTRLGAEDYCYGLGDKGESYDGNWNYAIDGTKCLPWDLRFDNNVTISGYADYEGSAATFLTGSACRNPQGVLNKPACITFVKEGNYSMRYCDVCHNEYGIQDIYDDCNTAVSIDPSICTGSTAGKCLKTCENLNHIAVIAIPPKVGDVTCPSPSIPSGAIQEASTVKSFYHPGDVIKMDCSSVGLTCLSSGKWTEWNDICKGCHPGWAENLGKCYKLTGRIDDWYKASTYCFYYYDAHFVSPKTDAEHQFFLHWRKHIKKNSKWWLGGRNWGSGWKWDDVDTLMSSFETHSSFGTPNDQNGGKNCVVHGPQNVWFSEVCNDEYNYICEKLLEGSPITCTDRKDECANLLRDNPLACTDPVVKTNVCAYTCGAEVCKTSGNECFNLPTPEHASMVEAKTSLGPGDFVQYTCDPGYELQSGSLTRACLRNGELSGCLPVCILAADAITKVNDFPMGMFRKTTPKDYVYTGESQQLTITRSGYLYSWEIYCACTGTVLLQVWRAQANTPLTYELVGQNSIECFAGFAREIIIDSSERIPVESGDLLGFLDSVGGCLTYYPCSDTIMPQYANVHLQNAWPSEMTPSVNFDFVTSACYMFALNAKIGT
ncbi:uncharacterized protein LOC121380426 [Gigantopelta aegis]|uniref:uncharacterized protein LOC121380426 n=1 Tax=Gigantopelta aegis TaxID=1735272 RepID=UPI001B88B2E7|nr:uncharacterized protein LOC121380426 [Gigantopelta aegis]